MSTALAVVDNREILGKNFEFYGTIEEPLFLAKDVAEWIEYDKSSVSKMLAKVDTDEKVRNTIPTPGGNQETWFLTEDGFYEVMMQSRKPKAKEFKRQVKALLKSIRLKRGYNAVSDKVSELTDELNDMRNMLTDSGIIKPFINPRYTFDFLKTRYCAVMPTDRVRDFYDDIGDYYGIKVPYSDKIHITVRDWIMQRVPLEVIQELVVGLETHTIIRSEMGKLVNLNGFGGNSVEWQKIIDEFDGCCAYCGEKVALIPEHIIPQTIIDATSPERCDLIENVVCSCGRCNGSKLKHRMDNWYKAQPYFSKERYWKILKHIEKYHVKGIA